MVDPKEYLKQGSFELAEVYDKLVSLYYLVLADMNVPPWVLWRLEKMIKQDNDAKHLLDDTGLTK